jgi:hypothetical protein
MESERQNQLEEVVAAEDAMPISRKPPPKKINAQLNYKKKNESEATPESDNETKQPKVYKPLKLRTKEGSISGGVALSQGTVVVRRVPGRAGCLVLEVGDRQYETVTKNGASMEEEFVGRLFVIV